MSDGLKSFINNIGVLCETWTVIYRQFLGQGMDSKEAMVHTQAFMTALISVNGQGNGGKHDLS